MKSELPLPVLNTSCCNISVLFQTFFGHNDDYMYLYLYLITFYFDLDLNTPFPDKTETDPRKDDTDTPEAE